MWTRIHFWLCKCPIFRDIRYLYWSSSQSKSTSCELPQNLSHRLIGSSVDKDDGWSLPNKNLPCLLTRYPNRESVCQKESDMTNSTTVEAWKIMNTWRSTVMRTANTHADEPLFILLVFVCVPSDRYWRACTASMCACVWHHSNLNVLSFVLMEWTALKVDRKRLKTEKFDVLNQMKQLYATLEDKEKELREFIRAYEKVSLKRYQWHRLGRGQLERGCQSSLSWFSPTAL